MPPGERCQPAVGFDGDCRERNGTHEAYGIRIFEEALDLGREHQIRNSPRYINRRCVEQNPQLINAPGETPRLRPRTLGVSLREPAPRSNELRLSGFQTWA